MENRPPATLASSFRHHCAICSFRVAHAGLVRARWTGAILDECFRSLTAARPELDESALLRTRSLMNDAVPDCLVKDYEPLMAGLRLPDPDDRHVLAAAVRDRAHRGIFRFPVQWHWTRMAMSSWALYRVATRRRPMDAIGRDSDALDGQRKRS